MKLAPLVVPDLAAGSRPVRVTAWLVEPGESVCEGDRLVELLGPGMTFDVAAPISGRLVRIEKFNESLVAPGDVVGWLEADSPTPGVTRSPSATG